MVRTILLAASLLVPCVLPGAEATNAPFSIQRREGISWLTKPGGQPFFSLGVCVVNQGAAREQFTFTNPGYAAFQHYQNSNRWAEATLKRLQAWKFTTVGGGAILRLCGNAAMRTSLSFRCLPSA